MIHEDSNIVFTFHPVIEDDVDTEAGEEDDELAFEADTDDDEDEDDDDDDAQKQ